MTHERRHLEARGKMYCLEAPDVRDGNSRQNACDIRNHSEGRDK